MVIIRLCQIVLLRMSFLNILRSPYYSDRNVAMIILNLLDVLDQSAN